MKSNGYGSFLQRIEFNVPLSQAAAVAECLNVEPDSLNDVMGTASFTTRMTGTRRGDDETVVWKLSSMLPKDVSFRIDWRRSEY